MNDDAVEVVPVVVVDLAVPWWWRYQQIGMIRTVVTAALVVAAVVAVVVVVSSLHGTITLYIRRLHNCVVRLWKNIVRIVNFFRLYLCTSWLSVLITRS